MNGHKILILDSGIGGVSVYKEIMALMPNLSVDYIADHAFFPYGTKSIEALSERVTLLVDFMNSKQVERDKSYSLVVIACNTASTVVLNDLRAHFDFPFVGVVPAIKPACASSATKSVGLLATEGTVSREYTHQLIRDFGADTKVVSVGSSDLVKLAEQKMSGEKVSIDSIKTILEPFKSAKVDCVVLGCTHFPLLKDELLKAVDWPVNWVDSGSAIAIRVQSLLKDLDSPEQSNTALSTFYSTCEMSTVRCQSALKLTEHFQSFRYLSV